MRSIFEFLDREIQVVLTDIDGTLTDHGRLPSTSYSSLCRLSSRGFHVIPVTGRPAGWCEMIARLWPVHGVVGENGAFYFRYDKKMRRYFSRSPKERSEDQSKLAQIQKQVLSEVPGAAVASDQFSRLYDLAIDFCEDVPPLQQKQIQQIVDIFHQHGATAKVSNIHVNGWYGQHDKVSTCKLYLAKEFGFSEADMKKYCVFIGDSPNDEPMFGFFPHSFAVANINEFMGSLKQKPTYVSNLSEAEGFTQIAEHLLRLQPL